MLQESPDDGTNLLISTLPERDRKAMTAELEWFGLRLNDTISKPNKAEEYAYFPTGGICSVISLTPDGTQIETGLIGKEGFVGGTIVLYADQNPYRVIVQANGRALRISREKLVEISEKRPSIRIVLLRFVHTFALQTAQTALANGHYTIERRLARWILMYHDRVPSSDLPMTHAFLAMMLAVRRPGITDALHILEAKHAIRASRGVVEVINRPALELIAGHSYGVPEREYEKLIGPMRIPVSQ